MVRLIIERTIDPLLQDIQNNFINKIEQLKSNHGLRANQLEELEVVGPALAMLKLRICDPAMGSGYSLVSLVDYLADNILEATARVENYVAKIDNDIIYQSPLAKRIKTLREQIFNKAKINSWQIQPEQLNDRLLVRRIIIKRVIYGVDINPMAVELSKISLWLHTFTVGVPLSFLDHHLCCGNSLFGEWVNLVEKELANSNFGLFINRYIQQAMQTAMTVQRIEDLPDIDIGEIKDSRQFFGQVQEGTIPLRNILNLRQALRWVGVDSLTSKKPLFPFEIFLMVPSAIY